MFKNIKEFISRSGKRIRPLLFIVGYMGFAKKAKPGLFRTALSLELLHDFMLVHDDIIDKSSTRRGRPSMHAMLNTYLCGRKKIKFNGEDLTIVIGDVLYALALHSFLAVKEDMHRKEKAMKRLIEAALYTGSGEFIELLYGMKDMDKISKDAIYKIYDLKTANYTFASPLIIGAILAGAPARETNRLFKYGIYLGRAFQIKDDILGLFSEEARIGKSVLTDLQEAKKTVLIWYAYRHSPKKDRQAIKRILTKEKVTKMDLLRMRNIMVVSGALEYARGEIRSLREKAWRINRALKMRKDYKEALSGYAEKILSTD